MLYFLQGKISQKDKNYLILDNQGIGYQLFVGNFLFEQAKIGSEQKIYIYEHLKKDGLELYGFKEEAELNYFKTLLNLAGVGPKTALKILSSAQIRTLEKAVLDHDVKFLTRISGIGKKTAERIILELQEKIEKNIPSLKNNNEKLVFEALINLGFSSSEASEAIRSLPEKEMDISEKIKKAIQAIKNSGGSKI
jgi:Holliday junction DNA helicase RuvA